jgi:hypothetical protein
VGIEVTPELEAWSSLLLLHGDGPPIAEKAGPAALALLL